MTVTVKDALAMLHNPKEVALTWNGNLLHFNFKDPFECSVYADYVVSKIASIGEDEFELVLAAQAVIRRESAVEHFPARLEVLK